MQVRAYTDLSVDTLTSVAVCVNVFQCGKTVFLQPPATRTWLRVQLVIGCVSLLCVRDALHIKTHMRLRC